MDYIDKTIINNEGQKDGLRSPLDAYHLGRREGFVRGLKVGVLATTLIVAGIIGYNYVNTQISSPAQENHQTQLSKVNLSNKL